MGLELKMRFPKIKKIEVLDDVELDMNEALGEYDSAQLSDLFWQDPDNEIIRILTREKEKEDT